MPAAKRKVCKDCVEEGITTGRPAPYAGPRCASHHRAVLKKRREATHDKYIRETYGITQEEYDAILESQGGKCAICQRATGATKWLAVDHDHKTGYTRGICCLTCNKFILGRSRDDPEVFRRAIAYLENPPAIAVIGERVAPIFGHEKEIQGRRKKRSTKRRRKA
ncbi:endonuclease VII domain-containing protein [Brevibacterium moorei]|uniref:endonuclease VII domain-containing protein n=1 Tax=Brevibacterium moorei TaxID=2968457 RepID=UPI00211CC04C|nr:endonuclease VII domain-containing protein [Brevibacterium sp. 68QC2CO]MCQ9385088.1 endonuclease VII domain-containing protein [Brevibacterium sp. 68QC2CO]